MECDQVSAAIAAHVERFEWLDDVPSVVRGRRIKRPALVLGENKHARIGPISPKREGHVVTTVSGEVAHRNPPAGEVWMGLVGLGRIERSISP